MGYFLRDRHSSVTALVDSGGSVTNTYSYSDYGAPALLDGRPGAVVGAAAGTGQGESNGLQYAGAAHRAMFTDVGLGTMMTPARFYDPAQGRFTARDAANVHNRYAGFDANPITKSDPSGLSPQADIAEDVLYCVVFAIAAVLTGIATFGAGAVLLGAAAAETSTALLVASFASDAIGTAANAGGFVANSLLLTNDVSRLTGGRKLFTSDQRQDVNNISTVLGSIAGVAGMGASGADAAIEAEAAATAPITPSRTSATIDGATGTNRVDCCTRSTTRAGRRPAKRRRKPATNRPSRRTTGRARTTRRRRRSRPAASRQATAPRRDPPARRHRTGVPPTDQPRRSRSATRLDATPSTPPSSRSTPTARACSRRRPSGPGHARTSPTSSSEEPPEAVSTAAAHPTEPAIVSRPDSIRNENKD